MKRFLASAALAMTMTASVFADSKVSNLTEQTTPKTTDYMYIVANSTSQKVKVDNLLKVATFYVSISSQEASNVVNQAQYLQKSSASVSYLGISSTPWTSTVPPIVYSSMSVTYTHLSTVASTYLPISSAAASNVVNQGQYLFVASAAASNLVNQGQYVFLASAAASNVVNQGQYLYKSSAASTYAPIVGGFIQNYYLDGSSITKGGVLVAGSNITLTPGAGITTIAATGGSGGSGTTISVEDGGSAIVATSTLNFTGAEFIVTNDGGEALVKLDQSSVTMLGANPAVAGDVSGTLSAVVVTDDSHAHTGTTLSGIDISDDTNLTVVAPIVLTGDQLSAPQAVTYSSASVTYTHLSTVSATYLTIASQTASNLVNQGQYMFVSSQAASNVVDQAQYLQKSSASVSYTHLSTGPKFIDTIVPQSVKLSSDTCVIQNTTSTLTSLLLCDASSEEYVYWPTLLRTYRGGGLTLNLHYTMASATSGDVVLFGEMMCVSPGDSADLDTLSMGTRASATDTVPGTAGFPDQVSISLTDDSCAVGDQLILRFGRSGQVAGDTATGDIDIRTSMIYEP